VNVRRDTDSEEASKEGRRETIFSVTANCLDGSQKCELMNFALIAMSSLEQPSLCQKSLNSTQSTTDELINFDLLVVTVS
jgi:hypothetical protein